MSAFLLDTNVALLAVAEPEKLTDQVRFALLRREDVLSVISYWEVVLKTMKGKLDVGDPLTWWSQTMDELKATLLPVREEHVTAVCSLPAIHQDPFDRLLVAQASGAGLTLLTTDRIIENYSSESLKVLR